LQIIPATPSTSPSQSTKTTNNAFNTKALASLPNTF
jgi:hypothetical protein